MQNQIYHLLTKEYSIHLATKEEDFQAIKNLRYEMYGPIYNMSYDAMEKKGYLYSKDDNQSFNYLLKHNASNTYVGTVRLFFINNQTPIKKLPMQKDGHVDDIDHLTHNYPICEVSRLALSHNLPKQEGLSALRLRTYLSLALMIATRINYFLYDYKKIFAVMEKSLARILKRQDANFQVIGQDIEYYGVRVPYAIEPKRLLNDTNKKVGQTTLFYLKKLCQDPKIFWNFIDNNPYLERSDIQLEKICQLFKEYGDDIDLNLLLGE